MVGGVYPGQAYPGGSPVAVAGVAAPFIASAETFYAPTFAHSGEVDAPYIDAATALYAPTLTGSGPATLLAPFLASTTVLYTPTVDRFTAPFITSTTVVHAATIRRVGLGAQPHGVSIGLNDSALENAPTWTRIDQ